MFRMNRVSTPEPAVTSGPSAPVTVASAEDATKITPPAYDGASDANVADEKPVEDKKEPEPEVPSDVLIETLLEKILNDWNNGPFVCRLKAYRTPLDKIVIREEKIKIEDGTTLEMGPFAGFKFYSPYSGMFCVRKSFTEKIELSRGKSRRVEGDATFNNMGTNQDMDIANKAVSTYFGKTMSYEFHVGGRKLRVDSKGEILSDSELSSSSSGTSQGMHFNFPDSDDEDTEMPGFDTGMSRYARDMDAMGQDLAEMGKRRAEEGERLAKMGQNLGRNMTNMSQNLANMSQNLANMNWGTPTTHTFSSQVGRQINYSGNGTQFNCTGGINVGNRVNVAQSMTFDEYDNLIEIDGRRV